MCRSRRLADRLRAVAAWLDDHCDALSAGYAKYRDELLHSRACREEAEAHYAAVGEDIGDALEIPGDDPPARMLPAVSRSGLASFVEASVTLTTDRGSGSADYWFAGVFVGGIVSLAGGGVAFAVLMLVVFVIDRIECRRTK